MSRDSPAVTDTPAPLCPWSPSPPTSRAHDWAPTSRTPCCSTRRRPARTPAASVGSRPGRPSSRNSGTATAPTDPTTPGHRAQCGTDEETDGRPVADPPRASRPSHGTSGPARSAGGPVVDRATVTAQRNQAGAPPRDYRSGPVRPSDRADWAVRRTTPTSLASAEVSRTSSSSRGLHGPGSPTARPRRAGRGRATRPRRACAVASARGPRA